ncbi:MAG: electron transport complex subunit E [Candidatus Omnitrophica bacterium]|nr:electron transport complex subunit E [Candidatus Omnitrophota bacterium]
MSYDKNCAEKPKRLCANCGREFCKGLWRENPIFIQVLGMCPALAVTTKALFGFSMGMATTFVLVCSSLVISSIRKLIPPQVRIATFTVIIATFVTCADYFLKANFYTISKELGPYVPLIVVNCIILGRQEVFTSKHGVFNSFIDALGMGVGFSAVLVLLGSIRELFGFGTIFYYQILGEGFEHWVVMALPAGAFITLGFLVGIFNWINNKRKK